MCLRNLQRHSCRLVDHDRVFRMLTFDKMQEGIVDCLRSWEEDGTGLILMTMRKNKRALNKQ